MENQNKRFRKESRQNRFEGSETICRCEMEKTCGGCQYLHLPYQEQLKLKKKQVQKLLKPYCSVQPAEGMEEPFHYRNKVHAVFTGKRDGTVISGMYEENTHRVIPVDHCLIENENADRIICDIRKLAESFKIQIFDEDRGTGLLRHVLIRTGHVSGEILVVLVTASVIFPSKQNFIRALLGLHPEITTIVQNINSRKTSLILGNREIVLYGRGYIEDQLCGVWFRISPRSFYQVNSVQAEKLFKKAIEAAMLTGKERVIDAYCGIGTIGLIAAGKAGEVIGVETNAEAVRDAVWNVRKNHSGNVRILHADAGDYLMEMAKQRERADVVFLDPPRSGSSERFLKSLTRIRPERIIYISCNPETLARDLGFLTRQGYCAENAWPFDLFPMTSHVETIVLLQKLNS